MQEIELKFLDIEVEKIKERLDHIGAVEIYAAETASMLFEGQGYSGWDSTKKFLRVRKVHGEVTITYKEPAISSEMTSREEVECAASSYEDAISLLTKLGFEPHEEYLKHRIHYELGDTSFELDTLQGIPTYLEIETTSEDAMRDICRRLDLEISQGQTGTIVEIYPEKFSSIKKT